MLTIFSLFRLVEFGDRQSMQYALKELDGQRQVAEQLLAMNILSVPFLQSFSFLYNVEDLFYRCKKVFISKAEFCIVSPQTGPPPETSYNRLCYCYPFKFLFQNDSLGTGSLKQKDFLLLLID